MIFIESPVSTADVRELLSDEEYSALQGVRVIYYHVLAASQIRMILIYRKGIKDDLTAKEKQVLRRMNEEW